MTWLFHMCDLIHSNAWHEWHGSCMFVTWLFHMCDMTQFLSMTWLFHTCNLMHSNPLHHSSIRVTWHIHIHGTTHSCSWQDSLIFVGVSRCRHCNTLQHPATHHNCAIQSMDSFSQCRHCINSVTVGWQQFSGSLNSQFLLQKNPTNKRAVSFKRNTEM